MDHVAAVHAQWRTERPDLDTTPLLVIGRIHRVAAALTPELTAVYARFGLGEGEFDVLATLRRQGEPFTLSPGELAARTMVTSGAVSKRLDRLEARGLVERRADATDGRARTVVLTPAGRALIDDAMAAHVANEARLLEALGARDRDTLARLLARLAESLGA
ncbi:MarR family transcriptional regulator [Phycicoccus sp. MAQZ13P-2]|uniref:MarR family winged helix-turn-helix transcriptional regulator n=1 Tax=Phycicoccus mangrovi TaxID=2840470 RepID=UPI001C002F98|nr:MarR family transcriptional regulator [Phycicoccus mangrovi]MBT9257966.1 MarR family transcriptional regulator [Phycicoccus mangrovi]MBT9276230.1 MarR family transcriptional regulator [Phycicoccus mangrovi]